MPTSLLHHLCYVINCLKVQWLKVSESVSCSCDTRDSSTPGSLSVGFPRQEYWSGLPFPSPGDLPDPRIELVSLALQADSLPSEPPKKTLNHVVLKSAAFGGWGHQLVPALLAGRSWLGVRGSIPRGLFRVSPTWGLPVQWPRCLGCFWPRVPSLGPSRTREGLR